MIRIYLLSTTFTAFSGQFAKTELERTFLKASQTGNAQTLIKCLENGVNPNVQDRVTGNTALHNLFRLYLLSSLPPGEHVLERLGILLQHPNINVNIKNTQTGDTPLHIAVRVSSHTHPCKDRLLTILQRLGIADNEIFRNSTDPSPHCVPDFASIYVTALLNKGANPMLRNYKDKLPIHKTASSGTFKLLLGSIGNNTDLKMIVWCTTLRYHLPDKGFSYPDYNGLLYALHANNFTSEIARGALLKIKQKRKKELVFQQEVDDAGCVTDDWKLTPLRKSGRILRYYCTLFDLLKSPEPHDPQKQCFPIFPREIVHHYFAVPATQAYIEKMQEEEAKKDSKSDE